MTQQIHVKRSPTILSFISEAFSFRSKPGYIQAIDGIRGFGMLTVALLHCRNFAASDNYFLSPASPGILLIDVLAPSSIGINIFFIISGFLIVGSILRKTTPPLDEASNFLAKRYQHLLPCLLVAILWYFAYFVSRWNGVLIAVFFTSLLALLMGYFGPITLLTPQRMYRLYLAFSVFLLVTFSAYSIITGDLFPPHHENNTNLINLLANLGMIMVFFHDAVRLTVTNHTMTLTFAFYICCAAVIWGQARNKVKPILVLIVAIIAIYTFAWISSGGKPVGEFKWLLLDRSWAFVTGILLAFWKHNQSLWTKSEIWLKRLSLPFVLMMILRQVFIEQFDIFIGVSPLARSGLYVILDIPVILFIASALVPGSFTNIVFSTKPLRFLGFISYSFFLFHPLALHIIRAVYPINTTFEFLIAAIFTLIIAIAISIYTYLLYEKKIFDYLFASRAVASTFDSRPARRMGWMTGLPGSFAGFCLAVILNVLFFDPVRATRSNMAIFIFLAVALMTLGAWAAPRYIYPAVRMKGKKSFWLFTGSLGLAIFIFISIIHPALKENALNIEFLQPDNTLEIRTLLPENESLQLIGSSAVRQSYLIGLSWLNNGYGDVSFKTIQFDGGSIDNTGVWVGNDGNITWHGKIHERLAMTLSARESPVNVQVTWNGTPLYYELAGGESQEILLNPTPALLNDWVISLAIIISLSFLIFLLSL